MAVSLLIYVLNKKNFPDPSKKAEANKTAGTSAAVTEMSAQEVKQRIYALFAVFGVVIIYFIISQINNIWCCYFLLVLIPSEWFDIDILCKRIH